MKKFTKREIMICKFTSDFIDRLVIENKLSDEKKLYLTRLAVEDLAKLFDFREETYMKRIKFFNNEDKKNNTI